MPVKKQNLKELNGKIDILISSLIWLEKEIAELGILILLENNNEKLEKQLIQLDNLNGKLNSEASTLKQLKHEYRQRTN